MHEHEAFKNSGSDSQQALSSIKVVKAFGQENAETSKFDRHHEKRSEQIKSFSFKYGFSFAISDGVYYIEIFLLFVIGGTFSLNHVSRAL